MLDGQMHLSHEVISCIGFVMVNDGEIGGKKLSCSLKTLVFCAASILHDTNYDM